MICLAIDDFLKAPVTKLRLVHEDQLIYHIRSIKKPHLFPGATTNKTYLSAIHPKMLQHKLFNFCLFAFKWDYWQHNFF